MDRNKTRWDWLARNLRGRDVKGRDTKESGTRRAGKDGKGKDGMEWNQTGRNEKGYSGAKQARTRLNGRGLSEMRLDKTESDRTQRNVSALYDQTQRDRLGAYKTPWVVGTPIGPQDPGTPGYLEPQGPLKPRDPLEDPTMIP